MRRLYVAVGFFSVLLTAAYYFALDGSIPEESDFPLDIVAIRALADAPSGQLPTEIRTEILAQTPVPYFALRAGGGFHDVFMTRTVFQIMAPGGYFVLEAGMDKALAEEHGQADNFYPKVWERVQLLLSGAKGIFVTHEHPDHMGGIVRHRNPPELASKLQLTMEQYAALTRYVDTLPTGIRDYQPFAANALRRIAPGIVMIPAGGHTAGSVIYYVKLASGAEYLFIGDIAYTESNVVDGVDRARFVRWMMVDPESRDTVVNQLRALHDLSKSEQTLQIVPAHADGLLNRLMETGALKRGFVLP